MKTRRRRRRLVLAMIPVLVPVLGSTGTLAAHAATPVTLTFPETPRMVPVRTETGEAMTIPRPETAIGGEQDDDGSIRFRLGGHLFWVDSRYVDVSGGHVPCPAGQSPVHIGRYAGSYGGGQGCE